MIDKFKMAIGFLGWEKQDVNDVLVEFAENYMKDIYSKIKNNDVKTLKQVDLNRLCDEFMYAFPQMIENMKEND